MQWTVLLLVGSDEMAWVICDMISRWRHPYAQYGFPRLDDSFQLEDPTVAVPLRAYLSKPRSVCNHACM